MENLEIDTQPSDKTVLENSRLTQIIQSELNEEKIIITSSTELKGLKNDIDSELKQKVSQNDFDLLKTDFEAQKGANTYIGLADDITKDQADGPGGQDLLTSKAKELLKSSGITDLRKGMIITIKDRHEYYYSGPTRKWVYRGIGSVSKATNTTLGIVQGSTIDGKISVDNEGTMSVVGWDQIKSKIQELENNGGEQSGNLETVQSEIKNIKSNYLKKDETAQLSGTITFTKLPKTDSTLTPTEDGNLIHLKHFNTELAKKASTETVGTISGRLDTVEETLTKVGTSEDVERLEGEISTIEETLKSKLDSSTFDTFKSANDKPNIIIGAINKSLTEVKGDSGLLSSFVGTKERTLQTGICVKTNDNYIMRYDEDGTKWENLGYSGLVSSNDNLKLTINNGVGEIVGLNTIKDTVDSHGAVLQQVNEKLDGLTSGSGTLSDKVSALERKATELEAKDRELVEKDTAIERKADSAVSKSDANASEIEKLKTTTGQLSQFKQAQEALNLRYNEAFTTLNGNIEKVKQSIEELKGESEGVTLKSLKDALDALTQEVNSLKALPKIVLLEDGQTVDNLNDNEVGIYKNGK